MYMPNQQELSLRRQVALEPVDREARLGSYPIDLDVTYTVVPALVPIVHEFYNELGRHERPLF